MNEPIEHFCVTTGDSMRRAMETINRSAKGVMALVVDAEGRLIATLSDGDIRRAMLNGFTLESTVGDLLAAQVGSLAPITMVAGSDRTEVMNEMRKRRVHQIPFVDEDGRVVEIVTMDELVPDQVLPIRAVIMAGGKGTRLRPLTETVPKPMLPLGGRPIMEHIVTQLRDAGIHRLCVSTHYKPEQIKEHFQDGQRFGVAIDYVNESQPLGTAGALALMSQPEEPLLVINGDILTSINFRAMLDFHRDNEAVMTVAVREYDIQVPYGLIDTDGPVVTGCREKPVLRFFVNAGIYLLEPSLHPQIPNDVRFDMTDLIAQLLESGQKIVSYPIGEFWLDIGRPEDYQKAQDEVADVR